MPLRIGPINHIRSIPCPWLPEISGIHDFSLTRRHGHVKGAEFYLDTLRFAQSQWISGKPAQAILQLNKAWMADLTGAEPVLKIHPSPYRALVWIMENAASGDRGFMGNPVRHFQHLASRISGPRAEIRSWRAWLCFHLAEKTLSGFPRDGEQLVREGLWIPGVRRTLYEVRAKGWEAEANVVKDFSPFFCED
ncbi:MAG: hypothetical protein ABIT37_12270 [Luteolibacter sp.]